MAEYDWKNNDQQTSDDGNTQPRTEHIYTGSYTYHTEPTPTPPKSGRAGRVALIAVAALLALTLCFGAGAAGSLLMADLLGERPIDEGPATVPSDPSEGEQQPDHPAQTPSDDPADEPQLPGQNPATHEDPTPSTPQPVNDTNRNPMPHIDKSKGLESVGYNGSAGENGYTRLTEAIDAVNETVVEIFTETLVNNVWLGNFVQAGAGSGVIISEDGYIVTNNHVISGASSITVRMTDQTTYEASVIGTDEASDIAVIWIDAGKHLPAARLGCSADLIVGEDVFAIGNPLGSLGGSVTDGIISATAREITIDNQPMTLLQTNAAVNPGNSGGGLFNMAGELIGVVNAKYSQDAVEGLGFAIPIDTAYEVICQLIEYGYVRGVVDAGLELYDVNSSNILVALRYFSMSYAGVYVLESEYSDEIKYGDLLLEVDGVKVASAYEAQQQFSMKAVGDTVTLKLLRLTTEGRQSTESEITVELTLREYVPEDVGIQFEGQ
jgi:serine protease Do